MHLLICMLALGCGVAIDLRWYKMKSGAFVKCESKKDDETEAAQLNQTTVEETRPMNAKWTNTKTLNVQQTWKCKLPSGDEVYADLFPNIHGDHILHLFACTDINLCRYIFFNNCISMHILICYVFLIYQVVLLSSRSCFKIVRSTIECGPGASFFLGSLFQYLSCYFVSMCLFGQ